jgi:hypothetical protein
MPEKMGFFSKFVGSMTKGEAYRRFYLEPLGQAMIYLLLLTVLLSGINSIRNVYLFNQGIDEIIHEVAYGMPYFELRDGRLRIDGEMPIYVDKTDDFIFVVDTSGKLDASVLDDYYEGVFISEFQFVQKTGLETTSYRFSDFGGFRVTKSDVVRWLPVLRWMNVFIVFFGLLFAFVGKLISAFIVGIGGMILELVVKFKVGFDQLYKLSIYALTLPMVLKLLVNLAGVEVPSFNLMYYTIALFYLWRALRVLRDGSEAEMDEMIVE